MSHRAAWRYTVSVTVLSALLLACGSNDGAEEFSAPSLARAQQQTVMSDEQENAVADLDVTRDEYEAGFRRYAACMREKGYEIAINGESYDLIQYGIPAEAVDSGVSDSCYEFEFTAIDESWQLAHRESSETAEFLRGCVSGAGLPEQPDVDSMLKVLDEAGVDAATC